MAVHRNAATAKATRRYKPRRVSQPVTLAGANYPTKRVALWLAGGDESRLKLARDRESIVILNNPRNGKR